jgi:hypothetical protein
VSKRRESKRREVYEVVLRLAAARDTASSIRLEQEPEIKRLEQGVDELQSTFDAKLPAARKELREATKVFQKMCAEADAKVAKLEAEFAELVPEDDEAPAEDEDLLSGRDPSGVPYQIISVFLKNRGKPMTPSSVWELLPEKVRTTKDRNVFSSVIASLADPKKTRNAPPLSRVDGGYFLTIDANKNGTSSEGARAEQRRGSGGSDARRKRLKARIKAHDADALTRLREALKDNALLTKALDLLLERWWRKDELAAKLGVPETGGIVRRLRSEAARLGIDKNLAVTEKRTRGDGTTRDRLLMSKLARLEEAT